MIRQRDTRWWFALNSASRHALLNGVLPWNIYPLINEFPKSGGSWLSQMLAEALELPNPRNRLPMLRSSIMHGHYLKPARMKNVVLVWRDGRDVMVSHYHHLVSQNNFAMSSAQRHSRKAINSKDPDDVRTNLPQFIEQSAQGNVHPWHSWSYFCNTWHNHSRVSVATRYESLLTDAAGELHRVQAAVGGTKSPQQCAAIAENYSFQRQTNRTPGQESRTSFLRKGIAGDWKNVFSKEAAEVFHHYHGEALIELGYEDNADWVRNRQQGFYD